MVVFELGGKGKVKKEETGLKLCKKVDRCLYVVSVAFLLVNYGSLKLCLDGERKGR